MKILKKNEANAIEARTRQEQIDEGIALAEKIENLRLKKDTIEQQHNKFIEGMKDSLEKEIAPLREIKVNLDFEINSARKELKRLLEPLNVQQEAVRTEMAKIIDKTQALNIREQNLIEVEHEIQQDRKKVDIDSLELKEKSILVDRQFKEYSVMKDETDKILKEIQEKSRIKNEEFIKREQILEEREKSLDIKEIDLDNRNTYLVEKEKNIHDKERLINDKYKTLLRTQKHGR